MDIFLTITLLAVLAGVVVITRSLKRMDRRLSCIERTVVAGDASSVHDTTHPAFSRAQLLRARVKFETEHRRQLNLESELYESADWQGQKTNAGAISPALVGRLRAVCEAVVQSECAWKEYLFMVEGNLSVATGRVPRADVVQGFSNTLAQTRGIPVKMTVAPTAEKVKRVDARLDNWVSRLSNVSVEALHIKLPDLSEETFDFSAAESRRHSALLVG